MGARWRSRRYWASLWLLWCVKGPRFSQYVTDGLGFVKTFNSKEDADRWADMHNRLEGGRHE